MKDNTYQKDDKPRGAAEESKEQNAIVFENAEEHDDRPVVESYNNGFVPQDTDWADAQDSDNHDGGDGPKYVWVGEYMTMTKLLFKKYRLMMYSFINRELRSDKLRYFAGFKALNRVINRDVCEFVSVYYWRIDREEFIADVEVTLTLEKSAHEAKRLKGYLVLWFDLHDEWKCSVEGLEREKPDRTGLTMLSPFLIPYYKSHDMDVESEAIWKKYLPEALEDREQRSPEALAERMGLNVVYYPLYREKNIESILFFKEGSLYTTDENDSYNKNCLSDYEKKRSLVIIPAGTIVINTERVKRAYSYFNIYHECFHNEIHYLFFRLQEMGNNDTRQIKMIKVPVDEEHPVVDPLYWAEKQANRGAYGLLMPMTETARMIEAELAKVESYTHQGSLYNQAGKALALEIKMPYFRVRARMIQLGHLHAKGALNFIKKLELRPFDFDTDSWRCDNHTFIIDELTMLNLRNRDKQFRVLLDSEKYIYADGHVVRNTPRFVEMNRRGEMMLTDWAERNVDQCCIRFYRSYEQKNPSVYYYGRMNFDTDYIKQTAFYLSDIVDEEKIDAMDAKEKFILSFPKGFKEALDQLRKKKKVSYDRLADYIGIDKATLLRWVEEPRYYSNKDFLTLICLNLELPDWISRLVFRRAGTLLDEDNKRDRALQYILRAQSGEGKDEANDYLKRMNLAELAV